MIRAREERSRKIINPTCGSGLMMSLLAKTQITSSACTLESNFAGTLAIYIYIEAAAVPVPFYDWLQGEGGELP